MPDIAMCNGYDCSIKETCYRYTAKPSEWIQNYFLRDPRETDGSCNHFIEIELKMPAKSKLIKSNIKK